MYKDADGRLYTREELDAAPGNLLTEYVPRSGDVSVQLNCNGFISVWDAAGKLFTVQGIQNALRYSSDPANASRPSCSCPQGFERTWCEHKRIAADAWRQANA